MTPFVTVQVFAGSALLAMQKVHPEKSLPLNSSTWPDGAAGADASSAKQLSARAKARPAVPIKIVRFRFFIVIRDVRLRSLQRFQIQGANFKFSAFTLHAD